MLRGYPLPVRKYPTPPHLEGNKNLTTKGKGGPSEKNELPKKDEYDIFYHISDNLPSIRKINISKKLIKKK